MPIKLQVHHNTIPLQYMYIVFPMHHTSPQTSNMVLFRTDNFHPVLSGPTANTEGDNGEL